MERPANDSSAMGALRDEITHADTVMRRIHRTEDGRLYFSVYLDEDGDLVDTSDPERAPGARRHDYAIDLKEILR